MSYSNAIRAAAALIGVLMAAQSIAATPEDGVVCRYEPRPGSRVLSHSCLTEAQWADMDKRQAAINWLLPPGTHPGSGGGAAPTGASQNWGGPQR